MDFFSGSFLGVSGGSEFFSIYFLHCELSMRQGEKGVFLVKNSLFCLHHWFRPNDTEFLTDQGAYSISKNKL